MSVTRSVRPLPGSSGLALLVSGATEPLDVELDDPRSALRRLPSKELQWISDTGFQLIVPLMGSAGTLVGFVGLSDKRSELPFSREDRHLDGDRRLGGVDHRKQNDAKLSPIRRTGSPTRR